MKFIFLLLAVFSLACSTRTESITKNLPLMPEGALKKPTSEIGSLNLKDGKLMAFGYTFSAFLWPMHPVYGTLEQIVEESSTDSRKIDELTKTFFEIYGRYERESALWTTFRCDAKLDEINPDQKELLNCEKTIVELGAHAACVCIVSNKPILEKQQTGNIDERDLLGQKIATHIEADSDGEMNWLLGGAVAGSGVGSKVSVTANENGVLKASVRLESFGKLGMYYKSVDVPIDTELDDCGLPKESTPSQAGRIINTKYDLQTKVLMFTLISKIETDAPGTRYEFVMERGFVPNGSPELTRFKGDLIKKNCAAQIVGFGSAKFDGIWSY